MAKIKPQEAFASLKISSFGGIGSGAAGSGTGADDMSNFRILPDGSLKTREGYRQLGNFSGTVRGIWEGTLGHVSYCFLAAGWQLFRVTLSLMEVEEVGMLTNGEGHVEFISDATTLYVLNGEEIQAYHPDTNHFEPVAPYAPLYGMNWNPSTLGDVYESINLLTPCMRVHYLNVAGGTVFRLPYYASSVDGVLVSGVLTHNFSFTPNTNTVTVPSASGVGEVQIAFSVSLNAETRQKILTSARALRFGEPEKEHLLFYGGANDYRIWCSTPVSDAMRVLCGLIYPNTDPLYFRAEDALALGDPDHPVTALCPLYDRVLAMHREKGWLLALGEEGVDIEAVIPGIGCGAPGGVVMAPDLPVTVTEGGVFRLQTTATHPEIISANCISDAVKSFLDASFVENLIVFWNGETRELWVSDRLAQDGSVLVWNAESGGWVRFEGIPASFFFKISLGVGFAAGNRLYLFDQFEDSDNGEPIAVSYQSGYFAFGHPETRRRGLRVAISATVPNGRWTLTLENERRRTVRTLTDTNQLERNGAPGFFEIRTRGERHRYLRYRIASASGDGMRVHGISFFTKT